MLLAAATWLTIRAVQVHGNLQRAQAMVSVIEPSLEELGAAKRQLDAAGVETSAARSRTQDPLWRAGERLPWVGDDLAAVRLTATSVDIATREVAGPLVQAATALDPDSLAGADGSIDVAPISAVSPTLDAAEEQVEIARATMGSVEVDGLLPPVADAVDQVVDQVETLASVTSRLARAGRLVPPMLGATEPRRYFLAFQNPAEARGTGGLIGIFGVLEVEQGRVELVTVGSNDDLPALPEPPVDLGPEYAQLYGDLPADLRNANLSPHFPFAAQELLGQWRQRSGEQLDGVVAVDPVVLGALLDTSGPVELSSGETVAGDALVDLTLREVYERFDGDDAGRRAFLGELVRETFEQITGDLDPLALAEVLAGPDQRRLLIYSGRESEQRDLEMTPFGGALPPADGRARGVVVNNAGANKLDYYLERAVVYEIGCTVGGRTSSMLRVIVRNTAPAQGLPEYVYSQLEALAAQPSTNRLIVSTFVPGPSGLDSVTMGDGPPLAFNSGTQLGYDVRSVTVDVPAGEEVELVWRLDEPAVTGPVSLLEQPLVRTAEQDVVQRCPSG